MSIAYELARCVACGAADAREMATGDDVRTEVELLWEHHSTRLRPDMRAGDNPMSP